MVVTRCRKLRDDGKDDVGGEKHEVEAQSLTWNFGQAGAVNFFNDRTPL